MKEIDLNFENIYEVDKVPYEELGRSGIYAVKRGIVKNCKFKARELLYIGESEDISSRLAYHDKKKEWERYLQNGEVLAVAIAFVTSGEDDRKRAEAACIFEHKPPCNTEHTQNFHYEKTKIRTSGRNAKLKQEFVVDRTE